MRYFILSLSFFWVLTSVAQDDQLIAYGKFKVEWGDMENTKILLYKSNQIVDSYRPTKNGKFEFELSLNNEYMFWFEKPGYVTKKVYFNTSVPKSVTDDPEFIPFPDFDFYVTLFKSYPEVDTMFFENPVGKILYNSKSNDFDWDKDYTLKILKRMEEIEDDIKRRHEEAEKLEKENRNQKSPDKIAQDKKKKEENKDDLSQIEANAPNINSENNLKEKRTTTENTPNKTTENNLTNAPFEEKQKTVTNKQSNTIQEFQLSQPQTKQVNRVMTEQIKGKTLTKTPVTEGKITLIYIKVEYTWGGRYFFIQDDANNYRNISEIYYNRMTSGKN